MQAPRFLASQGLNHPGQRPFRCRTRRQTQRKGIGGHSIGGGFGMNVVEAEEARSGVQIRIDTIHPERESSRLGPGLMMRQFGQAGFQLLDLKGRRH
jgi:hypothetical protein